MKTLTIGIIGAGRIGKVHTETIARSVPAARIKSIADVNLEEAKKLAEKFGIPNVSGDYRDIINDPQIEAVVICSPTSTHAAYITEAANAKKHIFCEKPVDLNIATIQSALKAVEQNGVTLMVGFNRRFDPNFRKVRTMVEQGKIGEPHILKITSRDPAPPPAQYVAGSGGMFLDMTIHDFDMARYIVGSEVTEVFAAAAVLVDKAIGDAGDVDTAVITLRFANGAVGVIDNSRKAVYGYDQRVEIFGSKGMVQADNNYPDNHRYYAADNVSGSLPLNFFMDRYIEAYATEVKEFCAAVIEKKPVSVGGRDGLLSVVIGLAAKRSIAEGRPVKISEVFSE